MLRIQPYIDETLLRPQPTNDSKPDEFRSHIQKSKSKNKLIDRMVRQNK